MLSFHCMQRSWSARSRTSIRLVLPSQFAAITAVANVNRPTVARNLAAIVNDLRTAGVDVSATGHVEIKTPARQTVRHHTDPSQTLGQFERIAISPSQLIVGLTRWPPTPKPSQ